MPLIRGHHSFDAHFTQIPNDWVRDARLSFKARGLLVLLMSHTPGWNMSVRSIARANGTGVDTVKSAVLELEQAGYLTRSEGQQRGEDGTFADYVWTTADPFQNPVTDKPVHGKQDTKKTITKEDQVLENNERTIAQAKLERAFEEFWKVYPRKVGKDAAKKAFVKAHAQANGDVVLGAQRYANDPNLPADKNFIPHPATWLNAGRWDDEPLPYREKTAEEKAAWAKAENERRRAIDLEATRRLREEAKAAEEAAMLNPPKRCEHDRVAVICPVCSRLNATSNE